jgi:octaprenyl-diphosphate synthase
MTLPLIYILNNSSKKDRDWIINSVKRYNKDPKRVNEVINFVKNNGGLDYAVSKMKEFQKQALELIQCYPQSKYKNALETMVNYVIDRKE